MKINFTRSVFLKQILSKKTGGLLVALLLGFGQNASGQSTNPPTGVCAAVHSCSNTNPCINDWSFTQVSLNGWSHDMTCTTAPYRFWNNLGTVTTLSPGAQYTINMKTKSTIYQMGMGAWIDYNQDGTFAADEFIGNTATTIGSYTRQFTVPCNAKAGPTYIRFRTDYYYAMNANFGCGNSPYCYGESMDYMIDISATSTPSANYTLPDSIYVNSPAKFVNVNQSGYIQHQWDVINQGANVDGSTTNFNYTFPSVGTYQLRLSSTNCQGTAITTKSFNVIAPTSSPSPNFVVSQNEVIYDGVSPIYVDFFDLSLYGATQWDWIITPDFMNGAPYIWSSGSNFDQNPSAFFYDVQVYDVCLAVGNAAGWDTLCKPGYINIKEPGAGSTFNNRMGQQLGSDVDSGLIYDSGGPNADYSNNEYLEFIIAPCGASKVRLSFLAFNVTAGDQLLVFDGVNSSAPQVGAFTGTNLPGTIESSGGYLFLVFLSNNTGVASGFTATWGSESPNNGAPNADFFVPDTIYQCSLGNDILFENTSTGVLGDQASYDWIFDYDPNVSYPTGYADAQDETNPTWSFFATGTYHVRMVLKSCEGNDTIVKTFVVDNTSNNPIVDFVSSESILKVGGITELKNLSVAGCEYEWVITPNTYSIENGGSEYDPIIDVSFSSPGSYNIKLIVTNDNGSSVLEKSNYINVIEYCFPGVFYPAVSDVGINKVQVGTFINNTPSGQAPGYSNYTDDYVIEMVLGQTYPFEIARNTNVNGINRKIWIDFNRDGDFADANELLASQTGSMSTSFTGTFTLPGIDQVVLGEARMRVGVSLVNTNLTACGPAQVGEYEDYTVILVPDNIVPAIQVTGNDAIIEVNSTYNDLGATAFDNIEGDITPRIVVDNGVNASQAGIYFVTYDVADKSGNQAVTKSRKVTVVSDLTVPTITLTGANPLVWSVLVPYVEPGFTAIDMPSGNNVDHLVSVSGTVNENIIGDYTLTYTVYDDFGNMSTATRVVQVRDNVAPTVVSTGIVQVQVGSPFIDPVTATDNFDMNPSLVKISGTVLPNVVGTYYQTYVATDMAGNQSSNTTVTFEVADYIAPTINYVAGTEIVIVKVFDANWNQSPIMQVTASDNYYTFADLEVIYPSNFSVDVLGQYTVTYKATDNAGNEASFERVVRVVDDVRPVIVTNPLNLPRWSNYDFTQGVNVKDNYYAPGDFSDELNGCKVIIIRQNVDFNYPGLYEVSYQAIDGSGNKSAITSRTIQINENGAMTGVEDINLENALSIYPNPNSGSFTVKLDVQLAPNATISIINAQGKVVETLTDVVLINGEYAINLDGVAAGVYFVRVESGNQSVNRKVTIQ